MRIEPICLEGYRLLHDGMIELAQVEANGIRIDTDRLAKTKELIKSRLRDLRREMEADPVWRVWKKRYGERMNLTSRDQLATILHVDLEYEVSKETDAGRPATDEEALQKIDSPFAKILVRYLKYEKALGTFLRGIEREVVDGRIHPSFHLHTARTYRSSSSEPNFQNFPVRDKEISQIIRSHFIASEEHVLVENDFRGAEVVVSAAYHKDPNFISYITDPSKDMHRDMAAQIYMLSPEEVTKDIRYGAKNKFVFPQFYGDFYVACAKNLWEWIRLGNLTSPGGDSLYEHLRRKGIKELGDCDPDKEPRPGTFESHIQKVERDFWERRFGGYGKWRKIWYRRYQDRGYFDLLTGFRIHGLFQRNAVVNYPVQGSAFHCLLWCLIRVNRLLRKYRMKSMVVGQIHDSMVGDVKISELRQYLEIIEQVTTVDLRKAYQWLVVPLEIEYEICPVGGSWYEKIPCLFKAGRFHHPKDPKKTTTDPKKFLSTLKRK